MAEKIKYTVEIDDNGSGAKVDNLNSKLKDTGKTAEDSQGKMGQLGQALGNIKGPVGQAIQGVQGLSASLMKLVMNPIGAVIAAIVLSLTALYKAFTSTKAGGEQMEQVMDAIGAALDVVRDRVLKVGGAIVKFFSGDFKGAFADAKGAVSGLTDEIAREAKEAANLRKELQNVTDAERELNKSRAEQNKLIANARLVLEDENASYAQRKKALEDVTKSEKQLAKEEENLTTRRFKAIAAQNALSDSSKEALDAEASAYIELQAAQENTLRVQRKLAKEAERLEKEEAAKRKQAAEERKAADKAAADKRESEFQEWLAIEVAKAETEAHNAKYLEDRLARELAAKIKAEEDFKAFLEKSASQEAKFIDEAYAKQALLLSQTLTDEKELAKALEQLELDRLANQIQARKDAGQVTTDLEQALVNKKIEIAKKEFDTKKALDQAKFDSEMELMAAVSGALSSFSKLAGEQTAAGKVLALASTVIDTYMGATKALAVGAGTPAGYINAAAIIATGLANVRTITAVQVPNETGASAPTMPSISGPSVGIIQGQMSQTSQLQAEMNAQMKRPTRAYVVGQNVTTQQSLDRHILENATL